MEKKRKERDERTQAGRNPRILFYSASIRSVAGFGPRLLFFSAAERFQCESALWGEDGVVPVLLWRPFMAAEYGLARFDRPLQDDDGHNGLLFSLPFPTDSVSLAALCPQRSQCEGAADSVIFFFSCFATESTEPGEKRGMLIFSSHSHAQCSFVFIYAVVVVFSDDGSVLALVRFFISM